MSNNLSNTKHILHPYEFLNITIKDIYDMLNYLICECLCSKFKEKLDGFSILCGIGKNGDPIFIRNNSDVNSENGGMSLEEIRSKYSSNKHQYDVFNTCCSALYEKLKDNSFIEKYGLQYNENERTILGCECLINGITNVMSYNIDENQIYVHYKKTFVKDKDNGKYIEIADEEIEDSNRYVIKQKYELPFYKKLIDDFYFDLLTYVSKYGLNENDTFDSIYKEVFFKDVAPSWLIKDNKIYERIFNGNKSDCSAKFLKSIFTDAQYKTLMDEKYLRSLINDTKRDISIMFARFENQLIDSLSGFLNENNQKETRSQMHKNLYELECKIIGNCDISEYEKNKFIKNYEILKSDKCLQNYIPITEGLVFVYKNMRMKMTGSFAVLNKLMGLRYLFE